MPSSSGVGRLLSKQGVFILILAALAVIGALWLVHDRGYSRGYAQAQADIQKLQSEAERKAAEEAAKSANPFQAVNPLSGVEANPFEKVKKVLNPFAD